MELERNFFIEPINPITTFKEMAIEIKNWANKKEISVEILSDIKELDYNQNTLFDKTLGIFIPKNFSMDVKVDNDIYLAKMEPPKMFMFKNGIATNKAILNYRFIYFYK